MARPRTTALKTTIPIRTNLDGWIEYRARNNGGRAAYLNDLAAADRAAALAAGGKDVERYRAYLLATDRDAELEAVDGGAGL